MHLTNGAVRGVAAVRPGRERLPASRPTIREGRAVPDSTAVLRYSDDGELKLPVKPATEGSSGFDVSKLLATTGLVTLDPGFVNTAACSSDITYIDGDAGILRYRGYPIEQLAERSTFLEVSYLLLHGTLPTSAELAAFTGKVTHHTLLDEDFKTFFS